MIINHIKTAFRNLYTHKFYSIINILGLSIGLACFILILFFVYNETSFDKHHDRAENIYRLGLKGVMSGNEFQAAVSGGPLGRIVMNEIPEVVNFARMRELRTSILFTYENKQIYQDHMMYADSTFFEVFEYEQLYGDLKTALFLPHSLVFSESTAKKYFGNEDPIGKIIKWNNNKNYTVTGVFKDQTKNSHIDFDVFISYSSLYDTERGRQFSNSFFAFTTFNYILTTEDASAEEIDRKTAEVVEKYMGDTMREYGSAFSIFLQPLLSIHLHSNLMHEFGREGDANKVYIFSAIAFLILFIACINFINLATARSSKRAMEVGIRKVFGANKGMLFRQFISESLLTAIISIGISLLLVELLLPTYNNLTANTFGFSDLNPLLIILLVSGLAFSVGLVSGSYPAIFISSFQPIKVLKGNFLKSSKKSLFMNVMVILQFIISVFLICSTIVVYRQLTFMESKDIGINKSNLITISMREAKVRENYETIKAEFSNISGVNAVTSSSRALGYFNQRMGFLPEGGLPTDSRMILFLEVDPNYLNIMKTKMMMGRNFHENSQTDSSSIIINNSLRNDLGWDNPLGKHMIISDADAGEIKLKIIGVVNDFNYASLHEDIKPMIIFTRPSNYYISVRYNPLNKVQIIKKLEEKWSEMYPSIPFDYFIQEERLNELYRSENTMGDLFVYFTFLAIFIAILGLFGLTTHNAEQRTKEVGIRKVMGGSITKIVRLLTSEFAILVIISNVIAWPLAYYFSYDWLQNFSYRTDIKWWIFPLSGILSLGISTIIVGIKAYQSASKNPVDALKYE